MFEAIDADNDGVISERELRRAAAALKTLDADNDGSITMEEVRPAGGFRPGGPGGPGAGAAGILERFDQNDDGKLSADEIPPQMMERFRGADTNGDGSIDEAELNAMMQSGQFGPAGRGGQRGQGFGRNGPGIGGSDPQVVMQQFMQSDRNGDGVLTANELSRQQLAMLQGADADGNAAISQQEFMQAAQQMAERARRFGGGPGGQGFGGPRGGRQGARPSDRFGGGDNAQGQAPQDRGLRRGDAADR